MVKFCYFVLLLIGVGCNTTDRNQFSIADREEDIHAIIETIAKRDSSYRDVKILSSLKKLDILFEESKPIAVGEEIIIPNYDFENEITSDYLTDSKNQIKIFDESDLDYLALQNDNPDSIYLNKSLLKGYNFIEPKELNVYLKSMVVKYPNFMEFTIPIFSKNNTVAYVQKGYYCGGLCGGGHNYILKKNNGKWVIIEMWSSWIS